MESLLFLVHVLIGLNVNVYCQCTPISVEQNFEASTTVFSGEVLSVDTIKLYDNELPKQSYREGHLATIKVFEIYKGEFKSDTIFVMTGNGYADCGYDFKVKKKCIIYARESQYVLIDSTNESTLDFYTSPKLHLTTNDCDRTTEGTEKEERLIKQYLVRHKK